MVGSSKLVTLAACWAVALTSASASSSDGEPAVVSVEERFARFKAEHQREYATEREEGQRLGCFRRNLAVAARRNERQRLLGLPEAFGVTQFADLCPEEFRQRYLSSVKTNATRAARDPLFSEKEVQLAQQEAFDWRAKGAVTPVGDEGQCGSTWAWAAVDTMEAQWFLKGNKLVPLSVQQVNSCDPQSQGCNGGLMDYAFQWVLKNKGIDSAADYPYTSGSGNSGTCNKAKLGKHVAHFSNYTDLPTNEAQLLTWVAKNGPAAVAVNAVSWQQYTGGVLATCDPTNVDHAVSLVGYTPQSGSTPAYWIVKNMWGVKWGEAGYIRLEYGKNMCGLTSYPSSILA